MREEGYFWKLKRSDKLNSMPVLTIEGDKAMGGALEIQAKMVANNVTSIVMTDTGHWLMEQRPAETKAALKKFFTPSRW